ncbi:MAG: thioredoxin family protein [Desulfovibrio sp.]|jgi:thioredoxin 1|nr:thioredoxin family protein [Desulfovibrio sp.]
MISEISQQEFNGLAHSGPALVEFYSKTCGPCKMLSFVLREIDKTMPDFPIYQIDFDANQELKERLGVKGFPTMIFFRDGNEVERMEGLKQKPAIVKAIEGLIV